MKVRSLSAIACVTTTLVFGCAAPAQDSAQEQAPEVEGAVSELTLAECGTQQQKCLATNPLLGLLTCPAQYAQCVITADNGLPAQVNSAIEDAAECARTARDCTRRANTPAKLAVCAEDEAQCVASIVGADLPDIVEGTAACVDGGIECITESRRVSDLAACAETLEDCAIEQIEEILPDEVVEVIGDINECARRNNACISGAQNAAELATCVENNAECVADSLGVTLPDVPLSEVVECTENAARCGLDASSIGDVRECAAEYGQCNADVIESVDLPEQLSCEQQWTACLAANPFNFLFCAAESLACQD